MTIKLPGYQIKQKLYQGTRTLVYRGIRETDSQKVVLKFLRNEYPSFNELLHFRNQYTITKNLNLPGVVKSLSLETYGNGYALVMEDNGAISLDKYESLDLEACIKIAIQIAEILHKLYQNRIIHKDIKPANLLIHPQTQQVKLIDFSIASVLPFETQEIQNLNVLEGTLAYISPEQTGRMNRGIDYRSDFYSLGVMFFELLNGQLPFDATDPMELIHCHLTKTPQMIDSQLPTPLVNIIHKLMAKNAEDRYQNALGLKYDLEKCLAQWEKVGKIETFKLGERDVSDRFLIPEKLYGRETEVQTLLDAFERVAEGNTEMMLVAGFSGIGKTAVINEVHKPIVRQRGYFIKGKFDQFNHNIPFSAFVQAFRDLMEQLLSESDAQLENWKAKILNAVGENAQIIIDVIPELEALIGQQPAVTELSGSAAQNRFNLLFGKFVKVFTIKDHPLVLFLDDLQWADSASLNLLKLLMGEMETGHLLVLGAYRDNEIFPAHPLTLVLDEIAKNQAILNTITLEALSESGLNHLIADTFSCSCQLAFPLTELVYQKTKGNPFFATQFLKALNEDEWISYNPELGYWQCDLVSVKQLALTDDIVEFMATQLQKLSQETQEILKLAACIGNQFDLATLAIVSEQAEMETATALWKALQEGLVLPTNEVYKFYQSEENTESLSNIEEQSPSYKFLHDRVQQASYSLIPEDRKEATHLKIGRLLLQNTLPQQQEEKIFEIVNHLNQGISLLGDRVERNRLSELNFLGGCKAKVSTAYEAAYDYFNVGIELLDDRAWEESYNLTLQLYECRAEVEYLNGDFEKSENDARIIIKKANNDIDRAKIYNLLVIQYTTMGQFLEAIEAGREGLKLLGIEFPKENFHQAIEIEQAWIKKELETRKIADFVDALEIESDRQKVAVKLLASLQPTGYFYNPDIWALSVVKCAHLLIQYGYTDEAPFGYTNYGLFLTITLEQYKTGYEFGCVGVQLVDKFHNLPQKSQVYCPFGMCLSPWVESSKISQDFAMQAYYAGLEAGNLQWAGYSLGYRLFMLFFNGNNLQELLKEVEICFIFGKKQQNQVVVDMAISCHVILSQLSDNKGKEIESKIDLIGESEILEHSTSIPQYLILKSQLCYLQEQTEEALHYSLKAKEVVNLIQGNIPVVEYNFYYCLILLALHHKRSVEEKQDDWKQLITNQKQMKKWSDNCPENFLHRYLLVAAEMARLSDEKLKAIEMYDRAIAGAKEYKFLQNEALANELAAKFYLDWGKERYAAVHMQEAYYCYARWGAKAKIDDLEQRYPILLNSILERQKLSLLNSTTFATLTMGTISNTTTGTGDVLDLATLMKASRTLSQNISLEGAIANLMQVVMENAGAETVVLMLFEKQVLMLTAFATEDRISQVEAVRVETSHSIPLSIINQVKHNKQPLVFYNASNETAYAGDTYIQKHQPQSVLCLPLLDRGQMIGILYLENNQVAGAFTSERVEILNLLCSQAAISLENAVVHQQAQQALADLQQAQLQLVQKEKMAALGDLMAGVAHEINNPLGFMGGNVSIIQDYLADVFAIIEYYQQELPHPSPELTEKIEELELEFLMEDFPKTIASMETGIKRIGEISNSLRIFTRTDTETKSSLDLHDSLDSTLLILKYRLKANENRPEIETVKNYGDLPKIECYPGQLSQVFMNILANAIDALDEANEGKTFSEIEANNNRITISTKLSTEKNMAVVKIADNGLGMSEKVCSRIFEQGFTTKGVGKGTGLGMAISQQIIVEKHGGTITCRSKLEKGTEFAIFLPLT